MKRTIFCVLFLAIITLKAEGSPGSGKEKANALMSISGKVMDEESKLPVETLVTIKIESFSPVKVATNKNGEFSANIPRTAECKIIVQAAGYDDLENVVPVLYDEEGTEAFIEVLLTPFVKLTLDGLILSSIDQMPMQDTQINIYWNSDMIKEDSKSIYDGKFTEVFNKFGWYVIDLSAPGYSHIEDTVWVLNCSRKNLHRNYYLKPIEAEISLQLTNTVLFNTNQSAINRPAQQELDNVVAFLQNDTTLAVELRGHTDSDGTSSYNLYLSNERAKAIRNYLVKKGIASQRIITQGLGETQSVSSNNTEYGKEKNRRVELKICKSIHKILFHENETYLNEAISSAGMDSTIELLKKSNKIKMEIEVHINDTGVENSNLFFTKTCSQSVTNLFLNGGVNPFQISAKNTIEQNLQR